MRRSLLVGTALLAIGGAIWLARHPGHPSPPSEAAAVAPAPEHAASASPALPAPIDELIEPDDTAAQASIQQAVIDPVAFSHKLETTLAIYRETMVYPRWSRPVDGSLPHLLDWNHSLQVGQPFAADRERREIEAHVVLDRSFAGPGDVLTAGIEVFRTEDHLPINPDKITARVELYAGDAMGWQVAAGVGVAPAGRTWQARFAPARLDRLAAAPRPARLVVRVEIGEFFKELSLNFRYAAAPAFVVLAKTGDRVQAGSLAVDFKVDVRHPQPTLVQAVLYDAMGKTAIATYSDWFRPTEVGPQAMTITFFGRVIRDKGIAGPYRIGQLHGHVQVPEADPLEVWWGVPGSLSMVTAAYSPSMFSSADYDSPEKQATIAHYEELIKNGPPA
jgi:hypothetical protein